MADAIPSHNDVFGELRRLREAGLPKLRSLDLPVLADLAVQVLADDSIEAPVAIEQLLRRAVERLGGGNYGTSAACLFGLETGTRGLGKRDRQERAAFALDQMAFTTFRTAHQSPLVSDVADQMLGLLAERRMREARNEMELRHPADSQLAVQWIDRFEAYNRIWTPVYGLGADLTAFRLTLLEENRPYDLVDELGPGATPYSQELQADGYARYALYQYARFEWELRQFITRHGGMWLFSGGAAETEAADAVYRISWHVTPFNERDQSFLRSVLQDVRGQEMHAFLQAVADTEIGQATFVEWMDWLKTCTCAWQHANGDSDGEYFPTRLHHAGITQDCQVHRVVEACADYCDLIDQEWRKIADWYHLDEPVLRGQRPEGLYNEWRRSKEVGSKAEM